MPKTKNKPTAVQSDASKFPIIVAAIEAVGVQELIYTGLAKKTSIHKYKKGDPVNPKVEAGILKAIIKLGGTTINNPVSLADDIVKLYSKNL